MILAEGQFYQVRSFAIRGLKKIELYSALSDKVYFFEEGHKGYKKLETVNAKNVDRIGEEVWIKY